jgi:hypothetical protein
MRDQRPAVARCLPRELVPTVDAHVRGPALQVSAHQSGRLITTECSHRWPARLWPAEIGAPRRSRTYNPLVGRHVFSAAVRWASLLVSGGAARSRSSVTIADTSPDSDVSGDHSGRLIKARCDRSSGLALEDAIAGLDCPEPVPNRSETRVLAGSGEAAANVATRSSKRLSNRRHLA